MSEEAKHLVRAPRVVRKQTGHRHSRVFVSPERGTISAGFVAPAMRAGSHGGAIVNTSSIAATGGTAGLSAYAASKGALDAMIRAIALEVGPQGITINNVSPGVIRTPMNAGIPDEALAVIAAHAALKRLGEPGDVGDVAVRLCTQDARFITGQSIVDGGFNIAGAR